MSIRQLKNGARPLKILKELHQTEYRRPQLVTREVIELRPSDTAGINSCKCGLPDDPSTNMESIETTYDGSTLSFILHRPSHKPDDGRRQVTMGP